MTSRSANFKADTIALAPLGATRSFEAPRFQEIAEQLRTEITTGNLIEHAPLPSERHLADEYGVSRMTARRALDTLVTGGFAYSEDRRGRFVSPARLPYNVSSMVSFVKDAQAAGSDLAIEVVDANLSVADTAIAQKLSVAAGDRVYEYTRLFRSKGHAIFMETEYLIAQLFPNFLEHNLAQSTTGILESKYNTKARTGEIVIRMRTVNVQEAELLGLLANQPAIELQQIIQNDAGIPFCFGRQLWRGELAEFTARTIVEEES